MVKKMDVVLILWMNHYKSSVFLYFLNLFSEYGICDINTNDKLANLFFQIGSSFSYAIPN